MELLEKYAYTVYASGSFSVAARELFISQPALSAAIARHEKNLGFAIFDRSVLPISLTPEGNVYIEYLEQKEFNENVMKNKIRLLYESSIGEVAIGAHSYSATEALSEICAEFSKLYPKIKVRLDMGSIGERENLSEKMKNHSLDLMLGSDFDSKTCSGIPLINERIVVAMNRNMPGAEKLIPLSVSKKRILEKDYGEQDLVSDLSVFDDIPFFEYAPFSSTRLKMLQIFGEHKSVNYSIENARQVNMHNSLMKKGLGAVLSTDFHLRSDGFNDDNLIYFLPKSEFSQRTVYIIMPNDTQLTPAAKSFLSVARSVYQQD